MDIMQRINDIGVAPLIGLFAIIALAIVGIVRKSGGRDED